MQQTETYKLNIIETSDPFSPEALNNNARALETQLARVDGEIARLNAALDALSARGGVAAGRYNGNGSTSGRTINVGFKPSAVIVFSCSAYYMVFYNSSFGNDCVLSGIDGQVSTSSNGWISMTSNGFFISGVSSAIGNLGPNFNGRTYNYFAFR